MSLKILPLPIVPAETACIVRARFSHGAHVVELRDALGALFGEMTSPISFLCVDNWTTRRAALAAGAGRGPAICGGGCLTGKLRMQCAAGWIGRSAISLDLTDPGFDHTLLSVFRTRWVAGKAEQRLLTLVVERARARRAN